MLLPLHFLSTKGYSEEPAIQKQRSRLPVISVALVLMAIMGCQSVPLSKSVRPEIKDLAPFSLIEASSKEGATAPAATQQWIRHFDDPLLQSWVERAIADNLGLEEIRYRLEAARYQRKISGSSFWPGLNLGGSGQRSKTNADNSNSGQKSYDNLYSVEASLSWEIDLWGKLYDNYKAADLRWQAEQAAFEASRIALAGQVAKTWYELVASQNLARLLLQRVSNLETNLEIIRSGYRQGIYKALDVYLARSDLASERSNLAQQQEQTRESTRQLQLLLGEYPSGVIDSLASASLTLPDTSSLDTLSISTDSVRHRYDLQASFLELAAADKDLAAAHKARFPSLMITGSGGDSGNDYKNLFDSSSLGWNLLGNLTQPLFAGGRLQAQEQQSLALLRQKEQQYLQALQNAFSEIEQGLSGDDTIRSRLQQLNLSRIDAQAAEDLAFDEYRQGLQNYTAVLEAQRRAFAARSSVITLRKQLLQNRVNIFLALGGNF